MRTHIFLLATLTAVSMTTAQTSRPQGILTAPAGQLKTIETEIDSGRFEKALVFLSNYTPGSGLDNAWVRYLAGLAQIGAGNLKEAAGNLGGAAQVLRKDADSVRVAGRLLSRVERKLGWIQRKEKRYDAAREHHLRALDLAKRWGSAEEEHECWISLDIDAWHKKDWHESRRVLEESLKAAHQIEDPSVRTRALALSTNNLGGTLSSMGRYEQAKEALQQSFQHWENWEKTSGKLSEYRVVWAHYGIADLHIQWARYLLGEGETLEAAQKKARAKFDLLAALSIGREREMPATDLQEIEKRLAETE